MACLGQIFQNELDGIGRGLRDGIGGDEDCAAVGGKQVAQNVEGAAFCVEEQALVLSFLLEITLVLLVLFLALDVCFVFVN